MAPRFVKRLGAPVVPPRVEEEALARRDWERNVWLAACPLLSPLTVGLLSRGGALGAPHVSPQRSANDRQYLWIQGAGTSATPLHPVNIGHHQDP